MALEEDFIGAVNDLGTAYEQVGADVPASTKWNTYIQYTNKTAAPSLLRLFVATATWTTGEPTGSELKSILHYDLALGPKESAYVSGNVLVAGEKIIARASVADSIAITVSGNVRTP